MTWQVTWRRGYDFSFRSSQEPLDMTMTAGNSASRALSKERASVIMASPATGLRAPSSTGGMSDPVIDEHFRRSLGKDYMNVFAPATAQQQQQQQTTVASASGPPPTDGDNSGLSGNTIANIFRTYQREYPYMGGGGLWASEV